MTREMLEELDQQYRALQSEIAGEWHLEGEMDGDSGDDPEYPNNSAYMAGYDTGRKRYMQRLTTASMFETNDKGDRYRGVDPGDCTWFFGDDDEF